MAPPNAARRFARRSSFKLQNFPAQPLQLDKPARKIAFRRARRRGLKLPSALRIRRSHLTDRWLFVIEQPIDLKIETWPFAVRRRRFACREAIDNPRRRRRNETWLLRLMTLLPVNSGTCDPLADLHDRFAAGFSGTNRKARGCRCGVTDQR
jgi:hypothetical protein